MKWRYAMVCSSNQNRSMEAHSLLKRQSFDVSSYGTGAHVKLPGPSIREPNVYDFGTPYKQMFDDLRRKDPELYISFYPYLLLHFPPPFALLFPYFLYFLSFQFSVFSIYSKMDSLFLLLFWLERNRKTIPQSVNVCFSVKWLHMDYVTWTLHFFSSFFMTVSKRRTWWVGTYAKIWWNFTENLEKWCARHPNSIQKLTLS